MRRQRRINAARYRARSRRVAGLVPSLARAAGHAMRWSARHVKPLVLVAVVVGLGWSLGSYLREADAFRVTRIQQPASTTFKLRDSLLGTNIWLLDVTSVAQELKAQQPWLRDVRVVRQLPGTIRIDVIQRMPIAQVKLDLPAARGAAQASRWYPVDRDGFVLPEGGAVADDTLVRLEGIERAAAVRAGKDTDDERLELALRVLQRLRKAPALIARRVTAVNVSDAKQLRFVLQGEIEVRCGSEAELDAHLERLRTTLKALARQAVDVAYIDLRFQEPVVGTRAS